MYLIPKRKAELTFSKDRCTQKSDCEFTVSAVEDSENMFIVSSREMNSTYIDEDGKGTYEFQQIEFLPIVKKAKHKIRLGDHLFFRKKIKKDQAIQVHVNSPNVIMYAACQTKCQVPD